MKCYGITCSEDGNGCLTNASEMVVLSTHEKKQSCATHLHDIHPSEQLFECRRIEKALMCVFWTHNEEQVVLKCKIYQTETQDTKRENQRRNDWIDNTCCSIRRSMPANRATYQYMPGLWKWGIEYPIESAPERTHGSARFVVACDLVARTLQGSI